MKVHLWTVFVLALLVNPPSSVAGGDLSSEQRDHLVERRANVMSELVMGTMPLCWQEAFLLMPCLEVEVARRLCEEIFDIDSTLGRSDNAFEVLEARRICAASFSPKIFADEKRVEMLTEVYETSLAHFGELHFLTAGSAWSLRLARRIRGATDSEDPGAIWESGFGGVMLPAEQKVYQLKLASRERIQGLKFADALGFLTDLLASSGGSVTLLPDLLAYGGHARSRELFDLSRNTLGESSVLTIMIADSFLRGGGPHNWQYEEYLLRRLALRHPLSLRSATHVATGYRAIGEDHRAEELLADVVAAGERQESRYDSYYRKIYGELGRLREDAGDDDAAAAFYVEALGRESDSGVLLRLAKIRLRQRQWVLARELLGQIATSWTAAWDHLPYDIEVPLLLATASSELGDRARAATEARQALTRAGYHALTGGYWEQSLTGTRPKLRNYLVRSFSILGANDAELVSRDWDSFLLAQWMIGSATAHDLEVGALRRAAAQRHPELLATVDRLVRGEQAARDLRRRWPADANLVEQDLKREAKDALESACPAGLALTSKQRFLGSRDDVGRWSIGRNFPDWMFSNCFDQLNDQLHAQDRAYASLLSTSTVSLEDVQGVLRADEVVLLYVIDQASFVAIIRADDAVFIPLHWHDRDAGRTPLTADDVRVRVDLLSQALDYDATREVRPKRFPAQTARELYSMLIEPVEPWLQDVEHVLAVKDTSLSRLPFEVLLTDDLDEAWLAEAEAYQELPWLIRRFAFSTIPGLRTLYLQRSHELSGERDTRNAALGVGNPVLAGGAGASIPGSDATIVLGGKANVEEIRRLPSVPQTSEALRQFATHLKAAGYRTQTLEGASARERTLRAMDLAGYSWIVFFTHALVSGEAGAEEPAIVLTPPPAEGAEAEVDPADDGALTMSEVARLDLNAEFVVLGGCRTAAPDATGGEALSGLARAFFYAGARSLLVSNWPLEVGASTRLLNGMMVRLRSDPDLGRSNALRASALKLIRHAGEGDPDARPSWLPEVVWEWFGSPIPKEYAHPFYWASLFVVGDGARPLSDFQSGHPHITSP